MKFTSVIRQRGQLTIPDELRKSLSWLYPNAAVNIFGTDDELIIKPQINNKNVDNWGLIRNGIKLSRSFKGKGKNLSEKIALDREGR
ncbi:MAG: hypothetical protein JW922_01940 [Paludibacteraceae bacterium]|nr:hypothetical protein [Paludibacteraceae bacterium]